MSFKSVDLKNATDQENCCIHTDSDDVPASASCITPPSSPPSPAIPTSPENAHVEDFWHMDVDDNLHHKHDSSASSTDPSGPTFSFSLQSNVHTSHPNNEGWTAPEQHYTRKHHKKLNGKY